MRSFVPIPGNPWPHDMTITVEDDPQTLVELLWTRETWNLQPVGDDLPPSLSDETVGRHAPPEDPSRIAKWQDAWPSIWDACVRHTGLVRDATMFDRLRETADGSPERASLLSELVGPSWRDEFGDEAFTDRYEAWNLAAFEARSRRRPLPLDETPERVSLATLIPAWQAGLSKIVTIPCRGSYTRVIGRHTLLVTGETREDPRDYGEALKQFR